MAEAQALSSDERCAAATRSDRLRTMLVDRAARGCGRAGIRRVALFGTGENARRYIRQPWAWRGIAVVACLGPSSTEGGPRSIDGVPVVPIAAWDSVRGLVDAVVVCSDADEPGAFAEARDAVGTGVRIIRPFEPAFPTHEPGEAGRRAVMQRLLDRGVSSEHAAWLADNRMERHDALFGTLPPERTELHLRRYWLAAPHAVNARVLDAACGTGYGAAVLGAQAAGVIGVDIDAATVAFARAYHGSDTVRFESADVTRAPCLDRSVDLVTSFETIEHVADPGAVVAEFARVLRVGGMLVLSTPNDQGLTAFHEQSLTMADLDDLLADGFHVVHRLGQRAGNDPVVGDLPPGMFPFDDAGTEAETLVVVAQRV